jgi:hypothetical protein
MQTYMADMLFIEFGVEEDEFNRLVADYNLFNTPAMQQMMFGGGDDQEYM